MRHRWLAACAALLALAPATARAQEAGDTLVAAGAGYQRGGLGRWLYGSRYRSLWATPVAAPAFGGELGLADSAAGASALWTWTPDGTLWEYRPLERDLVSVAPPSLRQNLLAGTIQGLNPVRHPGAAPVVEALADAAGVKTPPALLVRLVDSAADPAGGRLGYLIQAGLGGRTTVEVLDSLRAGGGRDFDARAFLRGRLFDTYIGQWDIAPDAWRWRKDSSSGHWTLEPRHREYAFARFDGFLLRIAGAYVAGFANFGPTYQAGLGLTPYQEVLDRQLLVLLDRSVWDSTAASLQADLTDSIIDAAVGRMPAAYLDAGAAPLAAALKARRDRLPDAARSLYRLVNRQAAFFGTDGADTVTITRGKDGSVDLEFSTGFHRSYGKDETGAIALYLSGGADHVTLRGPGFAGPLLDIAWAPGLEVTGTRGSGGRTVIYGSGQGADSLRISAVPDTLPVPEVENLDLSRPAPDPLHGSHTVPVPWFEANSDIGLLIGAGVSHTTYRVGHTPYYRRVRLRAGYTTTLQKAAVEMHAEFNRWRSPTTFTLDVGVPALTELRFFGYGNTTPFDEPAAYYQTTQRQIFIYPAWHYRLGRRTRLGVGPIFKQTTIDTLQNDLISEARPYGVPGFAQFGAEATATLDTRDAPAFARSGWHVTAGGSYYPVTFGYGDPFGSVQGSAATYLTPRGLDRVTLALRASARLTMGQVPVSEAAYIGGSTTLRGYQSGRYAGDAAAWFNSELRAELGTVDFVAPWRFGLVGIGDVGRVYYDSDNADVWHASAGGGFWMALPDRSMGLVVTAVLSDQGTGFWVGSGFMF